MNLDPNHFNEIFQLAIKNYHLRDSVNQELKTPYKEENDFDAILYKKCWIDSVQWHLEDLVRSPDISAEEAIRYKRRIDALNQQRTDLVEKIDDLIYENFKDIPKKKNARLNTETPGWAIDRLSILNLKIYHWEEASKQEKATEEEREFARQKLNILNQQNADLSSAIAQLFDELNNGKVIAKTYKQLKMYNDPRLNPVLRARKADSSLFSGHFDKTEE